MVRPCETARFSRSSYPRTRQGQEYTDRSQFRNKDAPLLGLRRKHVYCAAVPHLNFESLSFHSNPTSTCILPPQYMLRSFHKKLTSTTTRTATTTSLANMQSAFAAAALFFLAGLPLALGTGCYPNDCKSCPLDVSHRPWTWTFATTVLIIGRRGISGRRSYTGGTQPAVPTWNIARASRTSPRVALESHLLETEEGTSEHDILGA